jgi:HEAT repeats
MKARRVRWLAGLMVLVGVVVAAVFLEPTHVARGWLRGETFYRGRPVSYWKKEFAFEGGTSYLFTRTVEAFQADPEAALPVLRDALHDPDPNVRWPAVTLLGRCGAAPAEVVPDLVTALGDSNQQVRIRALEALIHFGPAARDALPALAATVNDPNPWLAHSAEIALWEIDDGTALSACNWRRCDVGDGFSVVMPAYPKRTVKPLNTPLGETEVHAVSGMYGLTDLTVAVSEYPADKLSERTEDNWFDTTRDQVVIDGVLLNEVRIPHGRERWTEFPGRGFMRSRMFWAGNRLYQIQATGKDRDELQSRAVNYFFASFRNEPIRP